MGGRREGSSGDLWIGDGLGLEMEGRVLMGGDLTWRQGNQMNLIQTHMTVFVVQMDLS